MKNKKFKFVRGDKIRNIYGFELRRIQAIKDFGDVKKGDKGGYIEIESCLSENGDCWVYDDCQVSRNTWVEDNAKVKNNSFIDAGRDGVHIRDNSIIDNSKINICYGYSHRLGTNIKDNAKIINSKITSEGTYGGNTEMINESN